MSLTKGSDRSFRDLKLRMARCLRVVRVSSDRSFRDLKLEGGEPVHLPFDEFRPFLPGFETWHAPDLPREFEEVQTVPSGI